MINGKFMKKVINFRFRILRVLYYGYLYIEVIVLNLYWVFYFCYRGCFFIGVDRYIGMILGCLYILFRVDMGWINIY